MKTQINNLSQLLEQLYKYRSLILYLLVLSLAFSCSRNEDKRIIAATSQQATLKIDDQLYPGSWRISPSISPDIFPVETYTDKPVQVTFYTDQDSITYEIGLNDSEEFIVLLNGKDSALTRLVGVPPKVNFTEEYISNNRGKWSVEVIEAQELIQVVSVITPTGLADVRSMIINHDSTAYYKEVLEHFLPYKNEAVVADIDSLLQSNWYINMKADACALTFDGNNKLVKSSIYDRMRGGENVLNPYLNDLTEFAKKTDFREFYKNHRGYYDSLIEWQESAIPTKKQWDWLESQFPDHSYDNYRITFSPLVKGNHSTVRFDQNGFKQAVMFIRPPYHIKNVSEDVSEGLITRFVFTEIDHNYVNPESDKHIERINKAFTDKEKWTAGKESKGYNSPYTVFNEYMTWSVYLLYCSDQYDKADFKIINDRIVKYMINRRGFHRFDDFHNTLYRLYIERRTGNTIADLYEPLLSWAESYQPD